MNTLKTTFLFFLIFQISWSQAPNKMSYQAVVRDADNNLVTNQQIGLKVSVLESTSNGNAVYEETHTTNSNINGLVTLIVGDGTVLTGNFATINWSSNSHFIKTEIDINGGTNYTITGVQQLLSVPYAMHANTADNLGGIEGTEVGELLYWSGTNWQTIPNGNNGQSIINCNGIPRWGFCIETSLSGIISSQTTAVSGYLNSNSNITLRGICYSTNPNPTTSDFVVINNSNSTNWTSYLSNLTPNTLYYARAFGTDSDGTLYGNEVSFNTANTIGVGDYYPEQGGIIFYTLEPGDPGYDPNELHGFIVSIDLLTHEPDGPSDSIYEFDFNCSGIFVNGTSQDVFTGQNNTTLILNVCPDSQGALSCDDLVSSGFNDWYLPSVGELLLLYQNRGYVNSTLLVFNPNDVIVSEGHMSSSDRDEITFFTVSFANGNVGYRSKNGNPIRARAIRTF